MIPQLLELAAAAAERAGALLLEGQARARQVDAKSSATDVVTQLDTEAERAIVGSLLRHRPNDAVLGEESGQRRGDSGVRWVIDPLDGTVNYLYGLPLWAVSIAAEVSGEVVAGVVEVPALGLSYRAAAGAGAHCVDHGVDRQLRVRDCPDLGLALIATGFGYRAARRAAQGRAVAELLPRVRDIRRCGAAALDLCWLADGRYDGYYERGLHPWDHAAGALIAREAGAIVTGAESDGGLIIGAVPSIHAALRAALFEVGAHLGD